MKVLLAEDDLDQLELRALLLARSGFETIPVRDTAAALRAAAARKPDCAVIDLRFPAKEHGLSLIRELKRLDAAMRIIVLTGASAGCLEKLPEKALVDEVMVKGSCSSHLIEVIRAWQQASDCARARNPS
jgi:DNA-binding response OmpR family regulator